MARRRRSKDKARQERERAEERKAFEIREKHAAGNAFDRMMADGGHYATLGKPKKRRKKKRKSAKLAAARERNKAAHIASLMRKDESLTPEAAEALWKKQRDRRKWERIAVQRAAALARKAAAMNGAGPTVEYLAYMRSPQWFAKREEALEYHGAKCDKCGTSADLQVHHKTYARLGQERMDDLQILCADCHTELHESDPKWVARQQRRAEARGRK